MDRAPVNDDHHGMSEPSRTEPLQVVIVGGGIAAIEAVLALHELAGAHVHVTLIAPEDDFVLRPLAVVAPFSRGSVDRLPLAQVMEEHTGDFVCAKVVGVDAEAQLVALDTGGELAYDALVVALGARAVPAFKSVVTFGEEPLALSGILADIEQGSSGSVAFVVPGGCSWPLPLYELALMTAEEAWGMNMDRVELHLVTPEITPLELFGAEASAAVVELLEAARITTHLGVSAQVERSGHVGTGAGEELVVDRVVAVPVLEGRGLDGIPTNANGFIPVDDAGLVDGLDAVYAVGDATDRPIKQGGLACQQADVAAAHIAARAGADVEVPPLRQVLRGRLLTGERDRFLRREDDEAEGAAADEPLWWPPTKVSGRYLSPYLSAKGIVHLPPHGEQPKPGIEVHVPLPEQGKRVPGGVLAQSSLRPITPRGAAPPSADARTTEAEHDG